MTLPNPTLEAINQQLADNQLGNIGAMQALSGGCIADSYYLATSTGEELFLKSHSAPPVNYFESEAFGLQTLADTRTLRTPRVLSVSPCFLLLEWIPASRPTGDYWRKAARQLAALHQLEQPYFGFKQDNFCGATPQPNAQTDCGYDFFQHQRLLYQANLANANGHLGNRDIDQIYLLADRLPQLIPNQPPSLIHGDLWSGNLHTNDQGAPVFIDPAAHFGWREADIAMTCLFGGFPEEFYHEYNDAYAMEPGWQDRLPLYNLYHLLNHLNLFGTGYLSQVRQVIQQFT